MDPSLIVVLLGHTGVGKSASGNTILGEKLFESRTSFKSVTTEITEKTKCLFEKQIKVVDTPGILSTDSKKIHAYCQKLLDLESSIRCLFLVVVKIDRVTVEQGKAMEEAIRVIGEERLKNSYILFTRGDSLDGMTIDDFIREDEEGLPHLKRFEGRHHVFDNLEAGQMQVKELFQKFDGSCSQGTQKDIRIVLFGLPGAGKSSSGNTILRSVKFQPGCGFKPVTTESTNESAKVEGRKITVVDTPGLHNVAKRKLFEEIRKTTEPRPDAIVFVVRLGRVDQADCLILERLPKIFGKDAFKYSMVLFTHGEQRRNQPMEDIIRDSESVFKLVSLCDNRYCVFDNTKIGDRLQVRAFLDIVDKMANEESDETSIPTQEQWRTFRELLVSLRCCCCVCRSGSNSDSEEQLPIAKNML